MRLRFSALLCATVLLALVAAACEPGTPGGGGSPSGTGGYGGAAGAGAVAGNGSGAVSAIGGAGTGAATSGVGGTSVGGAGGTAVIGAGGNEQGGTAGAGASSAGGAGASTTASGGSGSGGAGGDASTGGHGGVGGTTTSSTATGTGTGDAGISSDAGSLGWHLTTYFTAVESFFAGPTTSITGCLDVDCSAATDPNSDLGTFPIDFLATVEAEGTGLITSGPNAGLYLDWSGQQPGSGYWLDTAPRDAQGLALVAYVSAAAHPAYPFGATFSILACGVDSTTATPMDTSACAEFQAGGWKVTDRFENDFEVKHLDLYIGLQTHANMDDDLHFVDQVDAATTLP